MLLVLLIISVLLILIIPNIAKQTAHIQSTGCEAQVKMINSQIEAYTLKHNRTPSNINDLINDGLIKEGQKQCRSGETITIVFSKQATEMNIIEQNGNKYKLGLFGTKIISVAKVHTITFNNEGKINRFGSIILKAKENIYRVIFNIDKGRIRFVKLSN
ncbi:hypothetical protein BUZ27_11770 [Staphylococcus haemolyticus]|nr:hypothetical protein BUZ27_11770 [Staphylococcus haemolyticus]